MGARCVYCNYCKQLGRMQSQRGYMGRKTYYCMHPAVNKMVDKYGYPLNNFVGYGVTNRWDSPLTLRSAKRWCPLKAGDSNGG